MSPSGSGGGTGASSGSGGERGLVIHRVTKEISSDGSFPMLTKMNYFDWAALMRVMLQARGLWIAVSLGTDDYVEDRMALEVISKAVSAEMMGDIASKATAKIAWDAIRTMFIGIERVRKAKANTLRREFDALKFRDGETVDEFGVRITNIAHQLAVLNDGCTEEEIVRKLLRALTERYTQIAMAIETLLDLSEVSVEELIGRLKSAEERHNLGGGSGSIAKLNLTKDELIARVAVRMQLFGEGSSGGKGSSLSSHGGRGRGRGPRNGNSRPSRGDGGGGNGGGADDDRDKCRYCSKRGHWAKECRKKKGDEVAHVA